MNMIKIKVLQKKESFSCLYRRTEEVIKPKNKADYYIVFFASLLMLATGCKNKETGTVTLADSRQDTLQAFIIRQQLVSKTVSLPSQLEPFERAELFAKIQGYVRKMNVDIGEKVKAGEVLAVIEAAEYNANLSQSISSAQATKAKYQSSRDAFERLLNAAKEPGAIAEGELVKAQNQMMADSAAYDAAKQTSNAYSQLNNYLFIKAPFNGVITQRNADPGDLVSSNNPKPLLVIENNSLLRLKVPVPETYTDAATGTKIIPFTVDAIPGNSFTATIYRKSNTIDLANRTELWEFLVKNEKGLLRSGMYANSKLSVSRKYPSLVVPYLAVATNLEKRFIIKYHNGKSEWVDVRNGITLDSTVEIFGDIMPGDTLLFKATDEIKQGQTLAVKVKSQ